MDSPQVVIGPATPEDMPQVRSIVRRARMKARGLEDCRWMIKATIGTEIVGVAGFEVLGPYGFMRSVAVEKPYRHRKIGLALWQHLLDLSRRAGLLELYIVTTWYNVRRFVDLGLQLRKRSELPPEIRAHWQVSGLGFRLMSPILRYMYLKLEPPDPEPLP